MPAGSSPWRAELSGLIPAPTIAASLALLPLCSTRWRRLLLPLPLAGVVFEPLTLASMGRLHWLFLPLAVATCEAMLYLQRRARRMVSTAAGRI